MIFPDFNLSVCRRAQSEYYKRKHYDVDSYLAPTDPLKTAYINPSLINKFTKRPLPLWNNKKKHIGEVRDGKWDQRTDLIIEENHKEREWLYDLIFRGEYNDSVFHKSFINHFRDGVEWEETEFITKNINMIQDGHTGWKRSKSKQQLMESCRRMDSIFRDIKTEGYKRQENISDTSCLIDNKLNEVLVDIGRDGSLLLVDNRHRLSMAKILGLDSIPVCFLVRHKEWMKYRDEVYSSDLSTSHPDFSEFQYE